MEGEQSQADNWQILHEMEILPRTYDIRMSKQIARIVQKGIKAAKKRKRRKKGREILNYEIRFKPLYPMTVQWRALLFLGCCR